MHPTAFSYTPDIIRKLAGQPDILHNFPLTLYKYISIIVMITGIDKEVHNDGNTL